MPKPKNKIKIGVSKAQNTIACPCGFENCLNIVDLPFHVGKMFSIFVVLLEQFAIVAVLAVVFDVVNCLIR